MDSSFRRIFQVIDGNHKAVGDGFQVTSPMPGPRIRQLSPFLLIDHIGPMAIAPSEKPLGSPPHPHRGFETVTIMYQGVLAHRDTAGHAGNIGPGDVQWMTAGAGLMHEELYEKEFTRRGGTLEVVQLWVNMPKKDKMAPANYQDIPSADIKTLPTADGKGTIRVIAGSYEGMTGPASTFSPLTMLDVHLPEGAEPPSPARRLQRGPLRGERPNYRKSANPPPPSSWWCWAGILLRLISPPLKTALCWCCPASPLKSRWPPTGLL